jgi:hypothetical protein
MRSPEVLDLRRKIGVVSGPRLDENERGVAAAGFFEEQLGAKSELL